MKIVKRQPRIVMAVTNDLATDRRVLRHAATLREGGCEVVLVGRDDLRVRARRGWRFYAEYNVRLFFRLLRTGCDMVWANDADTLLGGWFGARVCGRKVVVDCHEIFPEVPELEGRPRVKRFWERLERVLLPRCDARLTVCHSVADYYRERLGVEMRVVRNMGGFTPDLSPAGEEGCRHTHFIDLSHVRGDGGRAMLLYQGCVNVGRGVDWAIDALEWLPDCRLVVAGVGDLYEEMRAYAASKPWAGRIVFLGRVPVEQLERLTPMAAVGLVMLEDRGLSYHYALPNRVGDFIAAGVPMVVSDLPEMAGAVRRHRVGEVLGGPGAEALAEAVRKVLSRPRGEWDFASARADFDWGRERLKLLDIVKEL